MRCVPDIATPALDDFRVSLHPAQSESREHCHLLNCLLILEYLTPLPLTLQIPSKSLQLGQTLLSGA